MTDSTMPLDQSETHITEVLPQIKSTIYNWSTGSQFMISKSHKVIVDALLEKEDFKYVKSRYKDEFGSDLSLAEIRKVLDYPNVQEYLSAKVDEKGIAAGLTLDAYVSMGYRVMMGQVDWKPEQVSIWKHLSKVRGFESGGGTNIVNSISIVQANGEK